MKSKLKFIIPVVLLLALGGVYKFALSKPAEEPKPKIAGEVYVLPSEFVLNLADGKYAKLGVALVMEPDAHVAADAGHGSSSEAPEGYGSLPQEAVVRDIVTDEVTESSGADLQTRNGRQRLKQSILKRLHAETDVPADSVLFTDVTVQ
ncbi:MAG: flagellar basal body-associated FliL family protein [Solirubrobacteraceae bacterium]|nr:flagellar basal body-associated FliL family protein [Solirubrobacteraceae bacterium]